MPKRHTHVVMIHGYGVTPDRMWFPWLHAEMEKRGARVSVPALPSPFRPDYKKWMAAMKDEAARWDRDTVVVAHSLGGALALRLLEHVATRRVRAVVIVSSPFGSTINVEPLVAFFARPIDWRKVRRSARRFVNVQAKDDPLVPSDHAFRYAEALGSEMHLFAKGGHHTGKKFPFLLKTVERFL